MGSWVLEGGPSDHKPFIQDFKFADGSATFRACTYNVEHSNNERSLHRIFVEIAKSYEAGILILQEVKKNKGILKLVKSLGYSLKYAAPEFCVAWDNEWEYVRHYRPQMSPTEYWTTNYALVVVLRHKKTGKLVKIMSYHPPAHVQSPKEKSFPVVTKVLRQVVRKWNKIARRNTKHVYACLFAGDDNVDEFKGYAPKDDWEFMLNGPLKQIRAPVGTHSRRKIDDFRITEKLEAV